MAEIIGISASDPRRRICWITTTPFIANAFLSPHLECLAGEYAVTLVVNLRDDYPLRPLSGAIRVFGVPLNRKVAPLADLRAVAAIFSILRASKFHAVHTFAPKAGLLGMLAAWLARVPIRIHTFQGEVWASRRGLGRLVLWATDWLTSRLATHRLVVGSGEKSFLIASGILPSDKAEVLADGSIAGVDLDKFQPDPDARKRIRADLGLRPSELIILFLGRLVRDKGVLDLADAFVRLAPRIPNAALVFVGPDEEDMQAKIVQLANVVRGRISFAGYTDRPSRFLAAADVLCLPSYREGFSTAILEAAACRVPAIATRIYGTENAVVDGVTGQLYEAGNIEQLTCALVRLLEDAQLRSNMGLAARERAVRRFSRTRLTQAMLEYYRSIFQEK